MSVHPHVALAVPFRTSVTFAIHIRVRGWSLWNLKSWMFMEITLCPLCSFLQRTEIYKASLTRLPWSPGSFLCTGQLKHAPLVWGFLWWRSLRRVTQLDLRIALISSSYLVIWRGRNNKGVPMHFKMHLFLLLRRGPSTQKRFLSWISFRKKRLFLTPLEPRGSRQPGLPAVLKEGQSVTSGAMWQNYTSRELSANVITLNYNGLMLCMCSVTPHTLHSNHCHF